MAQWLRTCFAVQATWVQILGQGTKIPHTLFDLDLQPTKLLGIEISKQT